MELTGVADCGALEGDEKSERVEEEVANGGSVRVERWVRRMGQLFSLLRFFQRVISRIPPSVNQILNVFRWYDPCLHRLDKEKGSGEFHPLGAQHVDHFLVVVGNQYGCHDWLSPYSV